VARRPLIAANWKMYKTIAEARAYAIALARRSSPKPACDLLVLPPYLALPAVVAALEGAGVAVGAQDLSWEREGAFTGEVSGAMIADAGATFVLVGHSERRHVLGEGDAIVARKLAAALSAGLCPILCVGERIEAREAGRAEAVVGEQLEAALSGRSAADVAGIAVSALAMGHLQCGVDIGCVASTWCAAFQSAFRRSESWQNDLQLFCELQPDGIFLACQHNTPVAMVAAINYSNCAYVGLMGVRQEFQNQGIGLTLMGHLLAWLEQHGVQQVLLNASQMGQPL